MFPSRQPFLLLVFWSSFYDVAFAKRCPDVHTKAGETVLLQSCNHEQASEAGWKWNYTKVIHIDKTWSVPLQFKDRVELNQNLSLTLRNAGLQDRGVFTFISFSVDKQWPTIEVHLVVHETISEEPLLTNNTTSSRPGTDPVNFLTPVNAACSSLFILTVVLSVSVYCCKRKRSEGDQDERTIYAVIDDVRTPDVKPAEEEEVPFYESINNINNSVQTVSQTVYDKIQKSRIMVDSTSPYETAGP